MKTKKFVIAMAIFGGVLFMAQVVNGYNVDAGQTKFIKKGSRHLPSR